MLPKSGSRAGRGVPCRRWPPGKTHPWVSSPRPPSYDLPQRSGATGDSTTTKPNEKQSPRANGIGSVPTTHIPARLEGPLGAGGGKGRLMKPNYSPSSNVRVQHGAAGWTWRSCCAVAMPCGGEAPSRQPARSACAHPACRQVTCIFHSLGFITSWNADLVRRAMRGFASLRVYFRCRVFFCQVRSSAKLVRESRDVWLRFGQADGNRAPLSADAAARRSTCSPSGAGAIPLISRGRHVCLTLQHVQKGFAGSWPRTGAERHWGRPTPPAGVGASSRGCHVRQLAPPCVGVEGAQDS